MHGVTLKREQLQKLHSVTLLVFTTPRFLRSSLLAESYVFFRPPYLTWVCLTLVRGQCAWRRKIENTFIFAGRATTAEAPARPRRH